LENYAVYIYHEHFAEGIINDIILDCDELFPYNRKSGIKFTCNSSLFVGGTCSNFQEVKNI
jgi:hypothetical protein